MKPRNAACVAMVAAAWLLLLASPFLFRGMAAASEYWESILSAAMLWVPLLLATLATFLLPRRPAIAVCCFPLAVPLFILLSFGGTIGLVWSVIGLLVLAANLVRPKDALVSPAA